VIPYAEEVAIDTAATAEVCGFCEQPGINRCAWSVPKFVEAEAHELKIGDIIKRFRESEKLANRPGAEVMSIGRRTLGEVTELELDLFIRSGRPYKTVRANAFTRVRVQREMPCAKAVCELHLRDLGREVVYCFEHWNAWKDVA
jgi:hypothetical protein